MPKDLIHFKIAERTAQLLSDTAYSNSLKDHEEGLLLGSVFHDAMFYAMTPDGLRLESLAHRLHGAQGEDTFNLIRIQAKHAAHAEDKGLSVAVLVGLISHLYADVGMHPLVWHLSGHYYNNDPVSKSEARQRHRALESLMDMVACPKMLGRARYRLRTLLHRCPELLTTGTAVPEIGDLAFLSPEKTRKELNNAWTIFSTLQWGFTLTGLARGLFSARRVVPRRVAEVGMLFYAPQLMKQADALQGTIQYTHPVTGRELTSSLEELMETAAARAAALCRQLEPTIFGDSPLLLPGPGPSMDSGQPGVTTKRMHYFADQPFPDLK